MTQQVRGRGRAGKAAWPQQIGSESVNNEFWMPEPTGEPLDNGFVGYRLLTPAEQAVLRRLRRGAKYRNAARPASGIRHRQALRRRRKALDNLRLHDIRSLVQIVMELGL
jgi:hypothetical protein